jgi:hypothetical protein
MPCVVADAMLVAAIGSAIGMAILIAFPRRCSRRQRDPRAWNGCCRSPSSAIAWTDIALAALAYRHMTSRDGPRPAIVEPWTISIAAFGWSSSRSATG